MVPCSLSHCRRKTETNLRQPDAHYHFKLGTIWCGQKDLQAPWDRYSALEEGKNGVVRGICSSSHQKEGIITPFPPSNISSFPWDPHSNLQFLEDEKVEKRNKECCMQSQSKIFGFTHAAQNTAKWNLRNRCQLYHILFSNAEFFRYISGQAELHSVVPWE